jgi:hypothetical protein
MKPAKLRQLLSQYGELGRIYCTPEDKGAQKQRKKKGGSSGGPQTYWFGFQIWHFLAILGSCSNPSAEFVMRLEELAVAKLVKPHRLSQYGELGRIYCTPEDKGAQKQRKKKGGNSGGPQTQQCGRSFWPFWAFWAIFECCCFASAELVRGAGPHLLHT